MSTLYYNKNNYLLKKSVPIPIPQTTENTFSEYAIEDSSIDNSYYFTLKIITEDNNLQNEYLFSCTNKIEHANLIKTYQKINYNNILEYELNIYNNENLFKLNGFLNNNSSSFVDTNDNIFIEFTQDIGGNTNCICYLLKKNINFLCISPPKI